MKRWSVVLSAAAICVMASSQAQASYQVIRWTSGFCQVWNHAIPGKPWPNDYKAVSRPYKSFNKALAVKMKLVGKRACW
jgi:hypothetical protein